jgi:hypothetical protein
MFQFAKNKIIRDTGDEVLHYHYAPYSCYLVLSTPDGAEFYSGAGSARAVLDYMNGKCALYLPDEVMSKLADLSMSSIS